MLLVAIKVTRESGWSTCNFDASTTTAGEFEAKGTCRLMELNQWWPILLVVHNQVEDVCRLGDLQLRGDHNVLNVLAACALSQVRDWRFPAVAGGSTTFQAPFVFTPPN